jgi:hypothetical protein
VMPEDFKDFINIVKAQTIGKITAKNKAVK